MIGSLRVLAQKTPIFKKVVQQSCRPRNMSTQGSKGLPLKQVIDALHSYAHPSLAGSWDNVGLLIEPTEPKDIAHILLTNDLTEDVMQEAVELQVDMIISYHPPIFAPLKTITTNTWKVHIYFNSKNISHMIHFLPFVFVAIYF